MARRATRSGRATRYDRHSRARDLTPLLFVVVLAVMVLVGLGVLPAKTWFSQRSKMAEAEAELARIQAESAELEGRLQLLATDEEIELRARRDFDLVYPGEESYRIVPDQPETVPDQPEP